VERAARRHEVVKTTLVVTSSWPRTEDEIAGTFVRVDALHRARDARVIVAAPRGPGVARRGKGLTVVELPHLGLFGTPGAATRPHRALGVVPFARAVAALPRPDAIVAHWLLPAGAIVRAAFPDVPTELIAHGADVRLLEGLPRALARTILMRLTGARVTMRAVSKSLADRLRSIAPALPLHVEPMPLPEDLESIRTRANALRSDAGPRLHVVAGRLVKDKRIERAIDHVATHGGRLVLVGDGPRRSELVRDARRRRVDVLATGALRHEDALSWIAAADCVLAPLARGEGAPTVIREARALGVPVVIFP